MRVFVLIFFLIFLTPVLSGCSIVEWKHYLGLDRVKSGESFTIRFNEGENKSDKSVDLTMYGENWTTVGYFKNWGFYSGQGFEYATNTGSRELVVKISWFDRSEPRTTEAAPETARNVIAMDKNAFLKYMENEKEEYHDSLARSNRPGGIVDMSVRAIDGYRCAAYLISDHIGPSNDPAVSGDYAGLGFISIRDLTECFVSDEEQQEYYYITIDSTVVATERELEGKTIMDLYQDALPLYKKIWGSIRFNGVRQ